MKAKDEFKRPEPRFKSLSCLLEGSPFDGACLINLAWSRGRKVLSKKSRMFDTNPSPKYSKHRSCKNLRQSFLSACALGLKVHPPAFLAKDFAPPAPSKVIKQSAIKGRPLEQTRQRFENRGSGRFELIFGFHSDQETK